MRDWWRQAQPVFVDDASSDQTVTLLGQGSASIIVADKTQVTFGTVFTGASVTRTLTLMNRGDLGLSVYGVSASGDGLRESDACAGATLASGGACAVSLTYAPTQARLLAADLRVESNATSSPLIARITGVAVMPIVAMSAAPLDFGRHPLGSYSWQSFVVNNTGAVSLTIAAVTLTDGALDYTITSDTCSSQAVEPGASCAVLLRFTPTQTGVANAAIQVRANLPGGVAVYAVSGVGIAMTTEIAPPDMARFAALRTPPVNQRLWLTILAETGYLSGFCLLMSLLIRLRWRRLRRTDMVAATLAAVTAPLALPSPGQAIAPDVMDEDAAEPALER